MANSKIIAFSVVVFVFFLSSSVANGALGGRDALGGRQKITDAQTNQEIQSLGKYSVQEYNRLRRGKSGGDLRFSKVVDADKQVVAGVKYYLKVEAFTVSRGAPKIFDAEVVVHPWARSKQLLNFVPSPTTQTK